MVAAGWYWLELKMMEDQNTEGIAVNVHKHSVLIL
jgi:hypothetical protein